MKISRPLIGSLAAACIATAAHAQSDMFADGWTLLPNESSLAFQSIKAGSKAESNSFAHMEGGIDEDGQAKIVIFTESVDTKIDLRNVRMRFLFFETFQFPEATITAQIDPGSLSDLKQTGRKVISMPYTLDLHGITKSLESDVLVTLIRDDQVSVSSKIPIPVLVEEFGLAAGLKKLEEAAGVPIIPLGSVTFDFLFARNGSDEIIEVASAAPLEASQSRALEATGDFNLQECTNRFETLSRSGGIHFAIGSSDIDAASAPLLDSLAEIVTRCPGLTIEVAGHTDNIGDNSVNQWLSERRAASVSQYLFAEGVEESRILSTGYGELRPVATNATAEGRQRNRRIEFTVVGG